MKRVIFVFFALSLFCCTPKTTKHTDGTEENKNGVSIDTIIIHHVDLTGIFVITDVPCEDFDKIFKDCIKKDTIINKGEIALLKDYLDHLNPIDSLHRKSIDTRAKIFLFSSSGIIEYCMDSSIIYSDKVYYITPEKLSDFIEKLQE